MNCRLARDSIRIFENIKEELNGDYDIELKQHGYLIFATSDKEVEQFNKNIALQNSLGIPSRLLTKEEALEIVPHLNPDIMTAASFCPTDGHCNPFLATLAYADAARRLGVKILTYTEVFGIEVQKGRVTGVLTDKGRIATPTVVNAAGGHAKEIGDMVGVDIPVYPERHQILVTEPVEPVQGPMVVSFSYGLYCQQTPHGSFIMGFGDPNEPHEINQDSSWGFLREMAHKIAEVLPPLQGLRVVRQWAGLYCISPDRQPILGAVPEVEGFILAVGFSGHGFMIAPMTGVLLAEHILGEETTLPLDVLSIERLAKGEYIWEPSVV